VNFVNNNKVLCLIINSGERKKVVNNIKRERSPIQIYALQLREPLSHGRINTSLVLLFAELRIWNVILVPATNYINGVHDHGHAVTALYHM
jgi:hypothetical protein